MPCMRATRFHFELYFVSKLVMSRNKKLGNGASWNWAIIISYFGRPVRFSCKAASKTDVRGRCTPGPSFLTGPLPLTRINWHQCRHFLWDEFLFFLTVRVLFRQRVQLFRRLVAKDKEELGITRPSDDFLPHGTLITVQRTRLLEVKHLSLQLTWSLFRREAFCRQRIGILQNFITSCRLLYLICKFCIQLSDW